jgi:2Fe-2S ferredoxin
MIKVTFVQDDGTETTIENIKPGQSLMEVGRGYGVKGIVGECGGGCTCATCHVYVDPPWEKKLALPDDIETGMLDMVTDVLKSNRRLSCQIMLSPELDGLRVTVASYAKT